MGIITELSAACKERVSALLPFLNLFEDPSLVDPPLQFCLREAAVQESGSGEQFAASHSIQEVNFDKAKSELVCNNR